MTFGVHASALEKISQEMEVFLATMSTVVAFASDQSTHVNPSADSLHGFFAHRALGHVTLFIGVRVCCHGLIGCEKLSTYCNDLYDLRTLLPCPFRCR